MKAEKDDMPDYIRSPRPKPSPWRMPIFILIGSGIVWAFMLTFARPIVIDIDRLRNSIRYADQPAPKPVVSTPAETIQRLPVEPTYEQRQADAMVFTEQPKAISKPSPAPKPAIRQTSFNDQNYTPTGAHNSIQPPAPRHYASNNQQQNQQRSRVNTQTARWHWDSPNKKTRESGTFEWEETNGTIDHSSVCQNYRKGSLIYRDCRKGAKQALKNMCGSYEPACFAGSNMMP